MRSISSRQNPIVRTFREAAADPRADGTRLFLDGPHLVHEALAAGLHIEHAAVAARHAADGSEVARLADALQQRRVDVVAVTEPVMNAMSPVRSPAGIVAIASRLPAGVQEILDCADAFVVAPVDVQDPGNLGALVRAAEAGGATGAVVCGASASPFSWKAIRGSMGSALRLPIAVGISPEAVLERARTFGLRGIASVPRDGESPDAIDWRGPVLLFVGGEGPGLSDVTIAACDARVTIPMQPPVESLNVAVAGALLVYEARRQRSRDGATRPSTPHEGATHERTTHESAMHEGPARRTKPQAPRTSTRHEARGTKHEHQARSTRHEARAPGTKHEARGTTD